MQALTLHRLTDGKPGLQGAETLSGQAFDALAIIDDARATRRIEENNG